MINLKYDKRYYITEGSIRGLETIFDKIDAQKRSFYGFNPVAILWNVTNWRKYFAFCVVVGGICWIVFGFDSTYGFGWLCSDSTWSQAKPFLEDWNWLKLLQGKVSFTDLWEQSKVYYGMGNHFSAPVIYGLAFIYLSLYLEKVGIKKSLNFCSTTALSLMSIGIFELMWNSLYAYFHGQIWVVTFQWKQVANLCAFLVFVTIGLLVLIYLRLEGYRPNFSKISLSFLLLTVVCWVFWINYPLPVGYITVDTTTGLWTNSNKFPQTYYCVDVDPTDRVAIGEPNWVQDDMVHFVNTFTKIVQTIFVLNFCMVKRIENGENRNE